MCLYLQIVFFSCFLVVAEAFFFDRKVDCLVTNWSPWSSPNVDGQSIRTCRILRMPANGGRACPHIREVKDERRNSTNWSGWSASFGFGQKSRIRQWIATHSSTGTLNGVTKCLNVLEEDIRFTGLKPTLEETANHLLYTFSVGQLETCISENSDMSDGQRGKVRDIVLILDSSGSIGRGNFDEAKQDAKSLFGLICPLNTFDVITNDPYQYHQLAMLTFSSSVVENFYFNTYDKTSKVLNAITNASYLGHATNTASAFKKAEEMFKISLGAREDMRKVKREVLILTDGMSNRGGDAVAAAKELSKVADVYGLMIGDLSNSGQIEVTEYVSKPASKHLFNVKDYQEFSKLVDYLEKFKKESEYSDWCAAFDIPT